VVSNPEEGEAALIANSSGVKYLSAEWAAASVFCTPDRDLAPSVEQVPEPAHVQAFIPKPAKKAFHVRVLGRFAGLKVNGVNASLDAPSQIVPRADLRSVIAANRNRRAPPLDDLYQLRVTRRLGNEVSTSSAKHSRTVDNAEDPQPPSVRCHIAGEIHRPFLIRCCQDRPRPDHPLQPLATSALDAQSQIASQ